MNENDTCNDQVRFSEELEELLQEMVLPIFRNQAEWMKREGCSDEDIYEFLDALP